MSLPLRLPYFAPEEYLSLERVSEIRHEYLDGCVYAVAGESPTHSTICFNLAIAIGQQIRGTRRRGFSPNMKVRAGEGGLYAYPDLAVACDEPVFYDQHGDVLVNPAVIFEVLSPSTENYDRGEKFARYRSAETLTDYVLVAQDGPRVEHFRRGPEGSWALTQLSGPDATLALDAINCRVPLADIYDRVTFPPL
jgi:Uma2 family endonuclease